MRLVSLVFLGVWAGSGVGNVQAALGHAPSNLTGASSVTGKAVPTVKMSAATTNPKSSLYTVQEVMLENQTVVNEYVTADGIVFAVTWRGPVLPDLSVLLGRYFSAFKAEADKARLQGRRGSPISINQDGLVVLSGGRMRNFIGHAFAADLIPAGVNIKDVLQ